MKHRNTIIAGIVAVLFLFAGYNLYSYFKEQQAIQQEEDRRAETRKIQKEEDRQRQKTEKQARIDKENQQRDADRQAQIEAEKKKQAEEEAERETNRQKRLAEAKRKKEAQLQARIQEARTPKHIEGIPEDTIVKFNNVAARYIRDHPEEFLKPRFDQNTFGSRTNFERLTQKDTNTLMLYSAISQDTDILQALLDIGLNINSANKAGYTPLMFASAYNSPEVVKFLIAHGADTKAKAYIQDLNALHIASLFNPKPDMIDALLNTGMYIEAKTENEYTPLLLAASDNRNLEVVERLAVKGADKTVYDKKGRTALKIVKSRIRGEGDEYVWISDEVNEGIQNSLNN